jgi:anti-sigma regulatory factor (Ser/Thr protein kinase)
VAAARREAKKISTGLGFDEIVCEEIALVVSELASNLVKHAGEGVIVLTGIEDQSRTGIQVESIDNGRGIQDIDRALSDGISTSEGLGYGLGTVNRLMDEFDISSKVGAGSGTRVICRRWIRKEISGNTSCPLDIGIASRPHPGLSLNGDAAVVRRWESKALVAVIDGLGHGQYAYRAARKAGQFIERHFDRPLPEIFLGVARECRTTRGVVMALACIDCGRANLSLANIGNIEVRLFGGSEPVKFQVRRGVIGLNAPRPLVTEHCWEPGHVMVLQSDGLNTHWSWNDYQHLKYRPASVLAQRLLHDLARDNDDATVAVVKNKTIARKEAVDESQR